MCTLDCFQLSMAGVLPPIFEIKVKNLGANLFDYNKAEQCKKETNRNSRTKLAWNWNRKFQKKLEIGLVRVRNARLSPGGSGAGNSAKTSRQIPNSIQVRF